MELQDFDHCARLLNTFTTRDSILNGKQLHLLFLKRGVLYSTLTVANRLLQMYCRCGTINEARTLFDEMPQRNLFTWNTLLEGYAKTGRINDLFSLFRSMPHKNEFSWNVIMSGLVRSGDLDVVEQFFREMPKKNEIAWHTMIHGHARNGRSRMALESFKDFLKWESSEKGGIFSSDPFVSATVIGACSDLGALDLGRQVHARLVIDDVEFDSILRSSLVNMYGKCGDLDSAADVLNEMAEVDDYSLSSLISGLANYGRMDEARRIFEHKPNPCVVLWNTIISGYVANGDAFEALFMFDRMGKNGILGDFSTFSSVMSACSDIGNFRNCVQLHAKAHKSGIIDDLVVSSALIDAYAKCKRHIDACNFFAELKIYDTILLNSVITVYCNCGRIVEAKSVFDSLKLKTLISWNSMMGGLSQNGYPAEALQLFCTMNRSNLSMDKYTLSSAITACSGLPSFDLGEQIFARAFVIGVNLDQVITSSLIDFYCKCGFVQNGRKLFDQTTKSDEVSWNSMLMGYATNGLGPEALALFQEMRQSKVLLSEITFTAVLSACDHCGLVDEGEKWFRSMKDEHNIRPAVEHYSCMVDLLARAGRVKEAIKLVEGVSELRRDVSMWSAVLRGCVGNGERRLAEEVAERIMEVDRQNSGAAVQLAGVLAAGGDWRGAEMVRGLMRDMGIEKSPGRSWL